MAIVAVGSMVGPAWEAAQRLADRGVAATVVNARFVKPLDLDTIAACAQESGSLLVVEENVRRGGFGEAVRDGLAERGLGDLPMRILAIGDQFVEHGSQPLIRRDCGLDVEGIVAEVGLLLGRDLGQK